VIDPIARNSVEKRGEEFACFGSCEAAANEGKVESPAGVEHARNGPGPAARMASGNRKWLG
jgi:hypothetical protein